MEIREYLHAIRRRLWIPVLLPLLAGGAAYAIVSQQPQRYQASVIVTIPSSISETDGALTVYSDNFKEAIGSEVLLNRVGRDIGISKAALDSGITAARLQRSILIKVSFTGEDRREVAQVVVKASQYTLDRLAKPKLVAARAAVKLARSRYDRDRAAMYRFYRTTGLVIPVEVYTTKLAELSQLERVYQEALQSPIPNDGASGSDGSTADNATQRTVPEEERASNPVPSESRPKPDVHLATRLTRQSEVAALQTRISRLQQELADLRPQVLRYRDLDADVTGSLGLLNAAQKDLLDTTGLAAASSSPLTLDKPLVTPISRPQVIARSVGVSMGLAFVLALGLLAVLELLWPSKRSGRHTRTKGQVPAVLSSTGSQVVNVAPGGAKDERDVSPSWF